MASFETLLPPPVRARYNSDENKIKTQFPLYKKIKVTHINCIMSFITMIILIIISIQITPIVNDANKLVKDGSDTLKDMSVIIPDVTKTLDDMKFVIPEVKKTLYDMDIIIPEVKDTIDDMKIIMPEIKDILRMVTKLCEFENFTSHYGFLCE